jgi:hypothetical protein
MEGRNFSNLNGLNLLKSKFKGKIVTGRWANLGGTVSIYRSMAPMKGQGPR